MMTFYQYVCSLKAPDSPLGDFISDFVEEGGERAAFHSWEALETYLCMKHAHPEALKAARNLWRRYERKFLRGRN